MNVNLQKALSYIDLGSYAKAVDSLEAAIKDEETAGDGFAATQYRCVLGELYAQLDMASQAKAALEQVVKFCDDNHCLGEQRDIAQKYLIAYETGTIDSVLDEQSAPAASDSKTSAAKAAARPGYLPLIPKPTQDKGFISKQMNKKRR